jgi:BASS family bile acid:Na+ symporter
MTVIESIAISSLFLFMLGMGCDTKWTDYLPVIRNPKAALVGICGQVLGLPLVAWGIISVFDLGVDFEFGLLIIACCPGGPSSNLFSWLANADVPLSIALTAVTSIMSVITIPFFLSIAAEKLSADGSPIQIDAAGILLRLFLLSLLPLMAGMGLLAQKPAWAKLLTGPLRRAGVILLVVLVVWIGFKSYSRIVNSPGELIAAVFTLILAASLLGLVISKVFELGYRQTRTVFIEIAIQNAVQGIAIASMIAGVDSNQLALPSTIYAGLMYLVAGGYVLLLRSLAGNRSDAVNGPVA